jgi:hypothetical protein
VLLKSACRGAGGIALLQAAQLFGAVAFSKTENTNSKYKSGEMFKESDY